MEYFIAWSGLIGAWLLVAGPLYQASLELRDEDIEAEHFDSVRASMTPPTKVSVWWWLLPPVKLILERRRSEQYRREFIQKLSQADIEAFISFTSKAAGWMLVSGGGLLLALKETYELSNIMHFSLTVFWVLVVLGLVLSIGNVIIRTKRSNDIKAQSKES